jgi:hypothetical protein
VAINGINEEPINPLEPVIPIVIGLSLPLILFAVA